MSFARQPFPARTSSRNSNRGRTQLDSNVSQRKKTKPSDVNPPIKQRTKSIPEVSKNDDVHKADTTGKPQFKEGLAAECYRLEKELKETSNKIYELTSANDDLKTRLSSLLGAKLQDNNPNIADLSDPKRPTQLRDLFSGFYDDECTNSFEIIIKANKSEVVVVGMLLNACVAIYKRCTTKASTDLQDLLRDFAFNSSSDVQLLKQLKDKRKKITPNEQLQSEIASAMRELFGEETFQHKQIQAYVQKCLEICWSMAVQYPPVVMDTEIKRDGQPFDYAAYRPYTQSGPFFDFIVWPALYLNEGGGLLYKGVAQEMGSDESKVVKQNLQQTNQSSRKQTMK
ncbi:uncharacterized protein LOC127854234 [Dreissena polymorpha]|uniref:Mitochondria-eating protein C-terminal domain-containing protein n=1 Tax=Dreissena polymorpha TaxID=45954 RepID=A0A9D4HP93_DREPO|nr:uncharacterized protein LOC127854234 [Dreissena polymorpha]XP_052245213.1 uncharacterized protein LOC127854234 [Dreissena polymorpha]KAH3727947.1 hypothetical protein DPMN_053893 [Dreissena polymorpha]